MPLIEPRALPNIITVARVIMAPAVFFLALSDGVLPRVLAFVLFVAAAFSDLWDGHLARKHGWISNFGKLMDPLADKLLLVATFVPFFIISHRGPAGELPYWGALPVWVMVVILGRELIVTVVRQIAASRGRVLAAGPSGKYKAVVQNLFAGSTLLWYALQAWAASEGWTGTFWRLWQELLHGPVIALSLLVALVLTVYSMILYFRSWFRPAEAGSV